MSYSRRDHYEIEKNLARRLKDSNSTQRQALYSEIYDELFKRVPDHPMLRNKVSKTKRHKHVRGQLKILKPYLRAESTFMEIGPGDCELSFSVARIVRQVVGIEVSEEIAQNGSPPKNFSLLISDGVGIPLEDQSVDVAYSDQLVEHLHPDDATEHFQNVYNALCPDGVYICTTPNKHSGPHDVSKFYSDVPQGMHLKEYSYSDLIFELRRAGFSSFYAAVGARGFYVKTTAQLLLLLEEMVAHLPRSFARLPLVRNLLAVRIIARK